MQALTSGLAGAPASGLGVPSRMKTGVNSLFETPATSCGQSQMASPWTNDYAVATVAPRVEGSLTECDRRQERQTAPDQIVVALVSRGWSSRRVGSLATRDSCDVLHPTLRSCAPTGSDLNLDTRLKTAITGRLAVSTTFRMVLSCFL